MQRRSFVHTFGAGLLLPLTGMPGHGWPTFPGSGSPGINWREWVENNDQRVSRQLEQQEKDPDHPLEGTLPNAYGIHTAGGTAHMLQNLAVAYVIEESAYYHAPELMKALRAGARGLLRMQHEDGTIDLHSTNFHSTPDLAFVVEPACLAYTALMADDTTEATLMDDLRKFLLHGGQALCIGGIHTPNHRWVVSMALARLHALFPNPAYLKRIEEWLYEKIDIDPDGQFTEKSTHVYSPLTDRCLITIARLLDRPDLYEPVRRNLEMTLYYVHPNGEVVTEASGRQDQYRLGRMGPYYLAYRFMALLDGDPRFSAMVKMIEATVPAGQLSNNLAYFLEYPSLKKALPAPGTLPDDYFREFLYSDLVRIRRGQVDATILGGNPTFFTFFKEGAALQSVRFASAFFGKGQFASDSLQVLDGNVVLRQELDGPYYQPYPVDLLPEDGSWEKMPRQNRPKSEVQYLRSTVKVEETEKGKFAIHFDVRGTDNIPLAIELGFRPGGQLNGVREVPGIPGAWILEEGFGHYEAEGQTITFGPGKALHRWTQLRGALPKLDAESVYLTGFTPFRFTLQIE